MVAQQVTFESSGGGVPVVFWIVYVALFVFLFASLWKVYTKAGHPGWASIIPIYNVYILCKIAGRPGWWVLLSFIPIVNIVIAIILGVDVAKNFGRSAGFGVGLALLSFVFYPILAWGPATYLGPGVAQGTAPSGPPTGMPPAAPPPAPPA